MNREGPAAGKGGVDLVAQGVSGLMSITGEAGRPPVKVGVPITDLGAALFAVTGILAALLARARTGRGQRVDKGSRRRHRGGRCVCLSVILHHPCKKMRPPGAGGNPMAFPQVVRGPISIYLDIDILMGLP